MKKDYYASKVIAKAALTGNSTKAVINRMVTYIVSFTTDMNVICSLLQGLVIDAKINNKEKLIEIVKSIVDEDVCEIANIKTNVLNQYICVEYVFIRFAKEEDETERYKTKRKQDDAYKYEVKVSDSCRININEVDWYDAIEFETI